MLMRGACVPLTRASTIRHMKKASKDLLFVRHINDTNLRRPWINGNSTGCRNDTFMWATVHRAVYCAASEQYAALQVSIVYAPPSVQVCVIATRIGRTEHVSQG